MKQALTEYDHPAFKTMVSTFVGYTLILALIFVVFFVVPFLLWP